MTLRSLGNSSLLVLADWCEGITILQFQRCESEVQNWKPIVTFSCMLNLRYKNDGRAVRKVIPYQCQQV